MWTGYFYADTFNAYRASQRSFAQMSMYAGGGLVRVEAPAFRRVRDAVTETVSPSYFDMVGARASAGRFFNESDDAVVVISEGFRRRIFGNGPGIGEAIKVDAVPATVIGVAADGFGGLQSDGSFDIIVPFAVMRAAGGGDPSTPFRSRTGGRTSRPRRVHRRGARGTARAMAVDSVGDAAGGVARSRAGGAAPSAAGPWRRSRRAFRPCATGTAPRSGCFWR